MYNQQQAGIATRPVRKARQVLPVVKIDGGESERPGNEHIRELLRSFGLRTSLIRLKVIDALHSAHRNGRSIGVRGVHSQLEQLDIPLSFLSVREVLKRLCTEGVISMDNEKCYTLNPEARSILEQFGPR
ncbi:MULTISPECIES: fe2+ zn2+ uptake regulation protein [Pseudomonas]|uniref:Fe2+ zn2+ uptake regulation protein n=1 Tax=Pseudomonas auratipiscis TaxID=3115853 RepID=A0AB35WWL8_9PSED|nr:MULTISPECIES: fe2+ zn2+ uptake regulation protein [unclassified Pseudomonas]MEE1868531.1 fe2+ zn2+ uptake regulation protein [Pseudomonas sp. 120P]MEE1959192.1 fe2+ zn2+ uptake regulation protein [Pseudomonas sp. 119P]